MAEAPDLKKFYEETIPNEKNLTILNDLIETQDIWDKQILLSLSNRAFGILAHFNINSEGKYTFENVGRYLTTHQDTILQYSLRILGIIKRIENSLDSEFNPSVIPMIQRYRKIFDAYEQQNGLIPFYLQKK